MESIKNIVGNFCLGSRKKEDKGKDREENVEEIELESNKSENVTEENQLEIEDVSIEEKSNAQERLEGQERYNTKEKRGWERMLDISNQNLEGNLDLSDFVNLQILTCSDNKLTNLNLSSNTNLTFLICWNNCLTNLDVSKNTELTSLYCLDNKLTKLEIGKNDKLTKFCASGNQLTHINLSSCSALKEIDCSDNQLTEITFSPFLDYERVKINLDSNPLNYDKIKSAEWTQGYSNNEELREKYKKFVEKAEEDSKFKADVVERIKKDFDEAIKDLTQEEQKSLIKELMQVMPSKELKERYLKNGLCLECYQPNTGEHFGMDLDGGGWCKPCNAQHFKQEFKNWTSGNQEIDKFIQKSQLNAADFSQALEWIPYDHNHFRDIEYLSEGGFGKVYKAKWVGEIKGWNNKLNEWARGNINPFLDGGPSIVALKILKNSKSITTDFLREITCHKLTDGGGVVRCFGISQDPKTKDYIIVTEYMKKGNLRQYLNKNYDKLEFGWKIMTFHSIVSCLNSIHEKGLIHCDLHPGNILKFEDEMNYITDLGLSMFVNKVSDGKIYGMLPYIAPEILSKRIYTQASDIYSFGMIAYELFTGSPPYHDLAHDVHLAIKICQGLRPRIICDKIPPLLEDLIKKCWDANPLNRPSASWLEKYSRELWEEVYQGGTEIYKQQKEVEKAELVRLLPELYRRLKGEDKEVKLEEVWEVRDELFSEFCRQHKYKESKYRGATRDARESFNQLLSKINKPYKIHPSAIYVSRLLDFKNLPEPQNNEELNKKFYEVSKTMEFNIDELDNILQQEQLENQIQIPPK